ncbi:MAG TPA: holo-ACP synthase [Pusillimonas sp.]|uniref:holo-ACP synthase n=1 Tax=Pusillimonas sp. TaxID=3040095 RepID=UPI002C3AB0DD|nr:holo-ACP synthase [Pusillimonas sp.]HUH87924.1 holo-ACP synthase [Pusillimonas sp.]
MQLPDPRTIAGIGTDVVRVDRVRNAFQRRGMRFAERILGDQEFAVFQRRHQRDPNRGIRYLATRFAAKEAFSKAIGLGMHAPMSWRMMQALNLPGGRPTVRLDGALAQWYAAKYGAAHISLSDESDMAMAFVVLEPLLVDYSAPGRR